MVDKALEAEARLVLQTTKVSLERIGREITRPAAAKGNLLNGGTVRALVGALVEQLESAANSLIAAHVRRGAVDATEIAAHVRSKLDPIANDFFETHANLRVAGLQGAFESLRPQVNRAFDSLADRATVALASHEDDDRRFALMAIDEARQSVPEDDRPHPKVGAIVVKNGKILSKAHRGENSKSHAEYIALEDKLPDDPVAGATVYTTLEPCTTRKHPKIPCAQRLVERKVARVVIGMLDPNPDIRGLGDQLLSEANIEIQLFPRDLRAQVEEMNREFIRVQKQKQPHAVAVQWTPNISQLSYINVPRLSQIAGLEGIQLVLSNLPEFVFLNDLGFELNRVLVSMGQLINKLDLDAVPAEKIVGNGQRLVGVTVSFSDLFRTKNGPKLYKARDKRESLVLSGSLARDPHIYRQLGSTKLVMTIDPRWITTSTAFGQFASGRQRFAGLCKVKSVENGLVIASPLILGTPKGEWDDMFR